MGQIGVTEILVIFVFIFIYFLPTIIALIRKKSNRIAIFLLNIFLGWTFIGWIVSLIWACTSNNLPQTIVVNNNNSNNESDIVPNQSKEISYDEKIDNLQKLKGLLDSGILTQEEFDQQKAKILV